MGWNDTVTLLILVDTILNAKLLVGGWLLWRWWGRRKAQTTAHWEGSVISFGADATIKANSFSKGGTK